MQEKHLAVISPQHCNVLYNADLLRVGSGSELKHFSTDFWPTKIVTQLFTHEFKATNCIILFFLFIEARRRKITSVSPLWWRAWSFDDLPPGALPGEPQKPIQGSFPSTASCSSLPVCRGLTPHSNHLLDYSLSSQRNKREVLDLQAPIAVPQGTLLLLSSRGAGPAPLLLLDSQEQRLPGVPLCPWVTWPKMKSTLYLHHPTFAGLQPKDFFFKSEYFKDIQVTRINI